jgi:superfamily II DNA or RNA helicase/DNA-directed RNA polymerase subunit RPC12/RpoP
MNTDINENVSIMGDEDLFGYQKEILPHISWSFRIQEGLKNLLLPLRVLIVMACGLGKTIISAFWLKNELLVWPKQKVLFLCHENDILEQAEKEYRRVLGSQPTFRRLYGQENGQNNKKEWLKDNTDIVFASFQSMRSFLSSLNEKEKHKYHDHFSILIVDESHHGQAPTFKEVIEYFEVIKRYGMTATPDREDLKDIRDLFGPEVINIPLPLALASGFLTPVEYHIKNDYLDRHRLRKIIAEVTTKKRRISLKQLNETIFIKKRDDEIAREIRTEAEDKKQTLIFCERIKHVKKFLPHLPPKFTAAFHSGQSEQENKEALANFRSGKIKYLLSVNKFIEGIDVPNVEVVVFLRNTDSLRIFIQQLGRGLRKIIGKNKVIILDFVANCERLLNIRTLIDKMPPKPGGGTYKRVIEASGENYSFIFDDEIIEDVYTLIGQIQKKLMISEIPLLLKEYSAKNELPANEVTAGTSKNLWWECSECYWEWKTTGAARVKGSGCPACANRVATPWNNLTVTHPQLAKEYSKKNLLPPNQVLAGTNKKLWWKCAGCGWEWQTAGSHRVSRGTGCPSCTNKIVTPLNNLTVTHPKLAKEYSDKNELPADKIIAGTNRKLWWKRAKCGHEWQASGNSRAYRGSGCPVCLNKVATPQNNLAVTHPELAKEYSDKNELPADKIVAGTHQNLWWKCSGCGWEWKAKGESRIQGTGCPACANLVVTPHNNMAATHPKLVKEYSSRNELPANKIIAGTRQNLWWKCSGCGHEWQDSGAHRAEGRGCPNCHGKISNLLSAYPELIQEYSDKNELPADKIIAGTNRKLWWKCSECGHEWQASAKNRVKGRGCPKYRHHPNYYQNRKTKVRNKLT